MNLLTLVALAIFFVVQGLMLVWLINNQLRMRSTLHRVANALTIVSLTLDRAGHRRQSEQVAEIATEAEHATSSSRS